MQAVEHIALLHFILLRSASANVTPIRTEEKAQPCFINSRTVE